jgi:predicted MFS family arabinose efflux permease
MLAGLQMATALGSVLGPMLGGYIYGGFGFNQINIIAAIACAAATVLTLIFLPKVQPTKSAPEQPQVNVDSSGIALMSPVAAILLAIILVQSAKMIPQIFFAMYAEKVLHAPAWLIGTSYGATALGLCLAAPFWARRFAQCSRHQILREVEYCCWACALLLGLQGLIDNLSLFVIARLIWGLFLAALLPVFYTILSRNTSDSHQGRVLGWGNSAAKAGALLGVLIGSISLAYFSTENLFWTVCVIYLACAIVVRWQRLDKKRCAHQFRPEDSCIN